MLRNGRLARVALLLCASGFCALTYQVAWMKEFRLVFGASTGASAAVLAIFIGGMGLGGLRLGPRADRTSRPLLLYATLEAGIALTAAVSPLLLWLVRAAYVALGASATLGSFFATALRLALATLVIGVPTFLMGGTLPAAARAVESSEDAGRRRLAWLYGINTLGAVGGTLLANFFLLEVYGTRRTLWIACLLNLLLAMVARKLGKELPEQPAEEVSSRPAAAAPSPVRRFVFAAAALVGFAFFLLELVWYRMLGPILGGTVFTFGLILAVALLGIGVGGALYASFGEERPATLGSFAATCLLEAVAVAIPIALGDRLAVLALLLRPLGDLGLSGHVLGWSAICSIAVFPVAVVAGYQFPLLIGLLGRGRDAVGRDLGMACAWNTGGAIAGALAGGFGLLPLLSAPGCWKLAALLLAFLGLVAAGFALWREQSGIRRIAAPAVLAATVVAMLLGIGPTAAWRHSGIGAGRAGMLGAGPNERRNWMEGWRRSVQWERDGVESAVALATTSAGGLAFVLNGKVDGNARLDAATQLMGGLVGAMLVPAPKRALVIGLGTGTTAGWLAAVPGMERVDVVELEPAIAEVARRCAAVNERALENPKIHIRYGDAREVLLTSRDRYDVIFSEPSNPYRAGISSLFTQEFYRVVRERLAPGGLFLQWVQAYEVDGQTLRTVYATIGSVFDEVETWRLHPADLLLVASAGSIPHDLAALRVRTAEEPYRSALAYAWRVTGVEGFFSHWLAGPGLTRAVVDSGVDLAATDDQNPIEFGFARAVGHPQGDNIRDLIAAARAVGEEQPDLEADEDDLDWDRLLDERLAIEPIHLLAPRREYDPDRSRPRRLRALAAYAAGDLAGVEAAWAGETRPAATLTEIAMLAEAGAEMGAAGTEQRIQQLRALSPLEADVVLARLRSRQGRLEEAAKLLAAALVRYRDDPWPETGLMQRAIRLAVQLAEASPALAPVLSEALREPFAVALLDDLRRGAALQVARRMDRKSVVAALSDLEPHIPWNRPFLTTRAEAYRAMFHPQAHQAEADLAEFASHEARPFIIESPTPRSDELAGPSEPQEIH
ncbi:MAG TPA: fused MFS/spermidine synthase [Myxococcales bacterium]|nr:fused MFS/spermidine synthase [Myxococcales bacterium]